MKDERFMEAVDRILKSDGRYPGNAYEFVSDAVSFTAKRLNRTKGPKGERHVSGHELVEGVAEFAVEQFGPLAESVMKDWGLTDGHAVGEVVFNMIREGLLKASDKDKLEDFDCAIDLHGMVRKPFEYGNVPAKSKPPIIA